MKPTPRQGEKGGNPKAGGRGGLCRLYLGPLLPQAIQLCLPLGIPNSLAGLVLFPASFQAVLGAYFDVAANLARIAGFLSTGFDIRCDVHAYSLQGNPQAILGLKRHPVSGDS